MTVRSPQRPSLRRCGCGGVVGPGGECAACRARRLRRQAGPAGPATAPPIVHDVLRSPGRPLEPGVRTEMETRFGHDFSRVRVHTDATAARSAQAVDALAYTVGRDIAFDTDRYRPGTPPGRSLLAHELAHVVQQGVGRVGTAPLPVGAAGDGAERAAERAADRVARGLRAGSVGAAAPRVARQGGAQGAAAAPAQVPGCALGNCSPAQRSTISGSSGDLLRAIDYVDNAVGELGTSPPSGDADTYLRWYFNSATSETVAEVRRRLGCIRACLVDTETNVRYGCDLPYNALAYVRVGDTPVCADAQVDVCYTAQHFGTDDRTRAETSIHECAHRVGMSLGTPTSTDDIYGDTSRFRYLSTPTSLLNSDSFALFAGSMSRGPRSTVLLTAGAGVGPAVGLGSARGTWHARFYAGAELQNPVLGMFSPTLGIGFTMIGERTAPGTTGTLRPSTAMVESLLAGVRIGNPRPGGAGGGYVSFFGGPALAAGVRGAGLGAEAGVALGYRWRWIDVSAGVGYDYNPVTVPGLEHVGTATISLTISPLSIGEK